MVPVTQLPSLLPDLCLENIFKRVPLRDLLRSVRVVCTNWDRVVPTELRRRRELVLVRDYNQDIERVREQENLFGSDLMEHVRREDGSPWVLLRSFERISFDALLVPGAVLTEGVTCALLDNVPTITHLTIVQRDLRLDSVILALEQIICLLNNYGHSLLSFKLDLSYVFGVVTVNVDLYGIKTITTALFESINRIDTLCHLTLTVVLPGIERRLSILSRLDTFTTSQLYSKESLMTEIRQHATGDVRIDWQQDFAMDVLIGLDPQLASKFISVDVENYLTVTQYDNFRLFGVRFSSLSRLSLSIDTMPMTMLARCLSPLAQLVHLKIRQSQYLPEDEQPEPEYVHVPSVRLLSLSIITRSHHDTERYHLAQIFPNLQVLSFYQFAGRCDVCEYEIEYDDYEPDFDDEKWVPRAQCIRLSRQPFRLCAHLHTIKHYGWANHLQDLFPRDLITRDQF